jgi:catechol 2,3-dioxygenase-like lactoylglutathione lyase family enzyme
MPADRGRWKLTGGQSLIAFVAFATAVFLGLMSVGAQELSYGLAAVLIAVVTVVAGMLLGLWHGGTATVLGTAHVISASRPPVGNIVGRCDMVLLVDLPRMDPVTITHRDPATPVHRWPRVGMVLPVEAAPRNPRNLRVRWNHVPAQSGPITFEEESDVVGPFFTEFRDAAGRAGGRLDEMEYSPTPAAAGFDAQQSTVVMEDPVPPPPGPDADFSPPAADAGGAAGGLYGADGSDAAGGVGDEPGAQGRPNGARPWDSPPSDRPDGPVIDAALLDDDVLDAELLEEAVLLGDTGRVDGAVPGIAEEDIEDAWVIDPEGAVEPVVPQPRQPHGEALVGEVVIDTSRVGEAARGIGMMLIVSDLAVSLHFYRDILGLHAVDVTDRTAELTFGGGRLLLCLVADMSPVNRRVEHLHLDVPDVEAAYRDLLAKGVEFPHAPRVITTRADGSELLAATFRDPDGHAVALTQWRDRVELT